MYIAQADENFQTRGIRQAKATASRQIKVIASHSWQQQSQNKKGAERGARYHQTHRYRQRAALWYGDLLTRMLKIY